MATYLELYGKLSDDSLRNRVAVAVVVAAEGKLSGTAAEQAWASDVLRNPKQWGDRAIMGVLAANKSATLTQIDNATDAAIQTNVDALVPALVVAFNL